MNVAVVTGAIPRIEASVLRGTELRTQVYKTWGLFARDNQDVEVIWTDLRVKANWTEIRPIPREKVLPFCKSLIGLQKTIEVLAALGCHDFRPSTLGHDFKGVDMICFHPRKRGLQTVQVKYRHTVRPADLTPSAKEGKANIFAVYGPGDGVYVNGRRYPA